MAVCANPIYSRISSSVINLDKAVKEKNYKFGVRARLALIFTLLLAGVSGTQYVINYRQQQLVMSKLVGLNRQINETIMQIDNQIKQGTLPAPASQPGQGRTQAYSNSAVTRQLQDFLDWVEGNTGPLLLRGSGLAAMHQRIDELRRMASHLQDSDEGSTFFHVTISVMDEMSRRSPFWHYTISSQPMLPAADDVLQVSIPIIEEGQVRFVHMQYEITDFLENFRRSRATSLLVTLISLGAGLLFALIYAGHFTSPIRRLNAAFSRVEKGDLDCRIDLVRKDELGALVDGFNQMVERLKQNKDFEKTIYRQERLSSLGKLAAGIAHEIKNPLNAINLSLQHLGDKLSFNSAQDGELFQRYSGNIQREVGRLSKIVDTFLNFSRVSKLEKSHVELNGLIEEVLTLLARDAHQKGVRVETSFAAGVSAQVDPEKMKTVFLNLIINAIEAMPSGGRLKIATSPADSGGARIVVSDTGCGIPQDQLDEIFELYYSTKENGSGLGLAIVNDIIRDHGGQIEVTSSLGTGTDFTINLPG